MKITFVVVLTMSILSCGVEAKSIKNETFCKSPKAPDIKRIIEYSNNITVEHGSFWGLEKTKSKIVEGMQIGAKLLRSLLTKSPEDTYNAFLKHKTIVPAREAAVPFISEDVAGGTLKHQLKEVQFEPCMSKYGGSKGIIVTAVFEKDKCDIILTVEILPFFWNKLTNKPIREYEVLNEDVRIYLQSAIFITGAFTEHKIGWIEQAFKNGGEVSSYLKNGYWTQEWPKRQLFVKLDDISQFLIEAGIHLPLAQKDCSGHQD